MLFKALAKKRTQVRKFLSEKACLTVWSAATYHRLQSVSRRLKTH